MGAEAYSYMRFSSRPQEKGDSIRRQTESRDNWLKLHQSVTLNTSVRMLDDATPSFEGQNLKDTACLGAFLELVKAGKVKRSSYLLVENLDRLSRQEVRKGLMLLLGLIDAGIIVVQLSPVVTEFSDSTDDNAQAKGRTSGGTNWERQSLRRLVR